MTPARPPLRHVGVVVPVRDEEELLPGCLAALTDSAARLRAARPDVTLRVLVVLDGCTDGSRAVVDAAVLDAARRGRGDHGPEPLVTPALGVGAARAAGAALLLRRAAAGGGEAASTWLAGTDADSTVPVGWLLAQVEAAEGGADAWVGTVELGTEHPAGSVRARLAASWSSHQRHHEDHDHVHGANLGVRGSAYLAAGGYPAVPTGEDVLLVERLRRQGSVLVRTARHPVLTSDRSEGRAPDGVAADLAELAALGDHAALPVVGRTAGRPGPPEHAAAS